MSRRAALVTGVSRPGGIGAAVARRLAPSHDLLLSGFTAYDAGRLGPGEDGIPGLLDELTALGAQAEYLDADLAEPDAPAALVERAVAAHGRLDALVAAHGHSTRSSLGALSAAEIDAHLAVNARATLLLVDAFARAHDPERGGGRVVLFSSGQRLGPMPEELAYVASKGGVEALTMSLADALAERGITVNAINPGPTDTGWATGTDHEAIRSRFPAGRWGTPDDAARAVAWLLSDDAAWITGQLLDSEGGFRR